MTETAIHLFGGVGFTWEHDAHLYYRRAWSAERLAGGPQAHRAALTARQLAADLRQVSEALGDLGLSRLLSRRRLTPFEPPAQPQRTQL